MIQILKTDLTALFHKYKNIAPLKI